MTDRDFLGKATRLLSLLGIEIVGWCKGRLQSQCTMRALGQIRKPPAIGLIHKATPFEVLL